MGRASRAIRTMNLPTLFSFFGVQAQSTVLDTRETEITARFRAEVGEIQRLCTGLREREQFTLFREALRLAYQHAER